MSTSSKMSTFDQALVLHQQWTNFIDENEFLNYLRSQLGHIDSLDILTGTSTSSTEPRDPVRIFETEIDLEKVERLRRRAFKLCEPESDGLEPMERVCVRMRTEDGRILEVRHMSLKELCDLAVDSMKRISVQMENVAKALSKIIDDVRGLRDDMRSLRDDVRTLRCDTREVSQTAKAERPELQGRAKKTTTITMERLEQVEMMLMSSTWGRGLDERLYESNQFDGCGVTTGKSSSVQSPFDVKGRKCQLRCLRRKNMS
jgi:hypothetical protein